MPRPSNPVTVRKNNTETTMDILCFMSENPDMPFDWTAISASP